MINDVSFEFAFLCLKPIKGIDLILELYQKIGHTAAQILGAGSAYSIG